MSYNGVIFDAYEQFARYEEAIERGDLVWLNRDSDKYIKVIDMTGATNITRVARAEWFNGSILKGFDENGDMILYVNAADVSAIFLNGKCGET